jgi:hypothetical protein
MYAMKRAMSLCALTLCSGIALALGHPPMRGTIFGRPVTCRAIYEPFGDPWTVASVSMYCRGVPRHSLIVSVGEPPDGQRLNGLLCLRGPRPPRWSAHRRGRCCQLTAGSAQVIETPGFVLVGTLAHVTATVMCRGKVRGELDLGLDAAVPEEETS